ncbi:phosphotransferase [Nocardiopsis sp. FIRDI 009]|uniref:phosphotransferase n=1 Tax=Nocardiopsis sp. FIRDI 009 TaxID=714197 RepID=UPI000E228D4C|nr:phosphotransferase [Nocardiopsis sp. FIRDI 009]
MTLAPLPGGFAAPELYDVLKNACATVGLDDTEVELLRGHTNAVVRLPTAGVVAKIARKGTPVASVQRTVAFVRWLMDQGFPTVPLHPGVTQPVVVDGHPVTFWTYLLQNGTPIHARDLAQPLHALHGLPAPPVRMRELDNVAAVRRSLAAITTLPQEELAFLHQRIDHLELALKDVEFALPPGVVQGDPQHRNALHDEQRTVLCDWDTVAHGQPEWDLVTVEIHCRRFGHGFGHYEQFADVYGFDVTTWSGYQVLRDIRELRMVTTNARKARHTPGSLAEVRRRIRGLQNDTELRWSIL